MATLHDPLVDEVEDVNPCYARVKYSSGREDNVSINHIAPCSTDSGHVVTDPLPCNPSHVVTSPTTTVHVNSADSSSPPGRVSLDSSITPPAPASHPSSNTELCVENITVNDTARLPSSDDEEFFGFRRSARIRSQGRVNYKED